MGILFLLSQCCQYNWMATCKEYCSPGSSFILYIKINLKWMNDLTLRAKVIKLLGENIKAAIHLVIP